MILKCLAVSCLFGRSFGYSEFNYANAKDPYWMENYDGINYWPDQLDFMSKLWSEDDVSYPALANFMVKRSYRKGKARNLSNHTSRWNKNLSKNKHGMSWYARRLLKSGSVSPKNGQYQKRGYGYWPGIGNNLHYYDNMQSGFLKRRRKRSGTMKELYHFPDGIDSKMEDQLLDYLDLPHKRSSHILTGMPWADLPDEVEPYDPFEKRNTGLEPYDPFDKRSTGLENDLGVVLTYANYFCRDRMPANKKIRWTCEILKGKGYY